MFRAYGTLLFGFRITHGLKSVSEKCVEPTALASKIMRKYKRSHFQGFRIYIKI